MGGGVLYLRLYWWIEDNIKEQYLRRLPTNEELLRSNEPEKILVEWTEKIEREIKREIQGIRLKQIFNRVEK